MSWAWEITTLAGVTVAEVRPREATVTRRLNGSAVIGLTLDADDASELATNRLIRGWREPRAGGTRVLRAAGRVTGITGEAATDSAEHVTLASASDGFGVVNERYCTSALTYTQWYPRDIINGLVTLQNGRYPTGLRVAAGTGGPPRDRTYEAGKSVGEAILQLAEVDDGFWFRVDPVDGGSEFSELVLLYPSSGGESGAVLGWGEGTAGNLSSVEVSVMPPVNHVVAFGAGDGDAQLRTAVGDAASIAAHGLLEVVITHTDVSEEATLLAHARDALRLTEQVSVRLEVAALQENTPRPWDDFDVGETLTLVLRGRTPVLRRSGSYRVTSFTVRVGDDGVERMTALDLEPV